MGNLVGLDLKLDEKYLAESVAEIVRAAIVQALGDPTEIIKNSVNSVCNQYVNDRGEKCNKDSWHSKPYLEYLAERTIEKTVREEMEKVIEENKGQFTEEIRNQLRTKRFRENTAEAFIDTMLRSSEVTYKMPITVNFDRRDEE